MTETHLERLARTQSRITDSCCNICTCLINCGSTDDISVKKKKKKGLNLDPNADLERFPASSADPGPSETAIWSSDLNQHVRSGGLVTALDTCSEY